MWNTMRDMHTMSLQTMSSTTLTVDAKRAAPSRLAGRMSELATAFTFELLNANQQRLLKA